ncbi:hypothetical protein [Kamptonema formosum]|uniref:hypothetical protein n=1 Tax=Kamptonema formosum TaxID=331992 RepID=UPI00034D1875|nr:hypothetical protein [Oscillatoria sp. PCC 10802]
MTAAIIDLFIILLLSPFRAQPYVFAGISPFPPLKEFKSLFRPHRQLNSPEIRRRTKLKAK